MAIPTDKYRWDDKTEKFVSIISDEWGNGETWSLRQGKDWNGNAEKFAQNLRSHFEETHTVRLSIFGDDTTDNIDIIFQAVRHTFTYTFGRTQDGKSYSTVEMASIHGKVGGGSSLVIGENAS